MNEIKIIRDLVGDYYSSNIDYKEEINRLIEGKSFKINIPVKIGFNPLPKKVKSVFFALDNNLHLIDSSYKYFFLERHQGGSRFYLFNIGDEIEISYLTNRGVKTGTSRFVISAQDLDYRKGYLNEYVNKPFLMTIIKKAAIVKPDYNKIANDLNLSLKKILADIILSTGPKNNLSRRIRLGRNNSGDITPHIINFFNSLKINLKPDSSIEEWQTQLTNSNINWGFKDVEELKALVQLMQSYENQADIMQGKLGLRTINKRVIAQVDNFAKDYETMVKLIKELEQL